MVAEEEDGDDDGGEMEPEVAAEMLVEGPTVSADEGTCSLITPGCEVIPSEESAGGHGHLKAEVLNPQSENRCEYNIYIQRRRC